MNDMKLAFCLFKYFPFGGMQRDFLRIAQTCQQHGHEVHIYTMGWEGPTEPHFHYHLLKRKGLQNHVQARAFAQQLQMHLKRDKYDLVIGFNKIPHLDIYFAADVCYQARIRAQRSFFYRLLPRYKQWVRLEKRVFAKGNRTQILILSPLQENEFRYHYQTEKERFHLLPPGIGKDKMPPENAESLRVSLRAELGLMPNQSMLLMVASSFKTKGLDRALKALHAMPAHLLKNTRLYIAGNDNPNPYRKMAKRLQIDQQVIFLGGRNDIGHLMLAADFLLHPAYHDNTGTVILEALVAGLPVLTVDCCGYAHYVQQAQAGIVLCSPFQQAAFNQALANAVSSQELSNWQQNALAYTKEASIYNMHTEAVNVIESFGPKP